MKSRGQIASHSATGLESYSNSFQSNRQFSNQIANYLTHHIKLNVKPAESSGSTWKAYKLDNYLSFKTMQWLQAKQLWLGSFYNAVWYVELEFIAQQFQKELLLDASWWWWWYAQLRYLVRISPATCCAPVLRDLRFGPHSNHRKNKLNYSNWFKIKSVALQPNHNWSNQIIKTLRITIYIKSRFFWFAHSLVESTRMFRLAFERLHF